MRDFHSYLDRKRSVRGFAMLLALIAIVHWVTWLVVSESLESNRIEKIKRSLISMSILQANPTQGKTSLDSELPVAKTAASEPPQSRSVTKASKPQANLSPNQSESNALQGDAQPAEASITSATEPTPLIPNANGAPDSSTAGPSITVDSQPANVPANLAANKAPNEDTKNETTSYSKADLTPPSSAWIAIKVPPPESKKLMFTILQGDSQDGSVLGTVVLDFASQKSQYTSRFSIRFNWATRLLADDREWVSSGSITETGLEPSRFSEKRGKRPERVVELDATTQSVKFANTQSVLVAGLQDRISVIWQLSALASAFASEPSKFVGREIDLPLVVSNRIVQSRWRVAIEMLSVNATVYETIHFVRTDARDDDLRFEFWLAINEKMNPIKIKLSDGKGRKFELLPQS